MKSTTWFLFPILFTLTIKLTASSYVALQNAKEDSLVRISEDGKSVTTIAQNCAGTGLAIDRVGDYIIAAGSALLRVTNDGKVTTIASAPGGSDWAAVLATPNGNFVVADRNYHVLWKISEGGDSVVKFANYPGDLPPGSSNFGLSLNNEGNYLFMRISDDNAASLYRITPAGSVLEVSLYGAVESPTKHFRPKADQSKAVSGGSLTRETETTYLFRDHPYTGNIFRLTASGDISKVANIDPARLGVFSGLTFNSNTDEIIATVSNGIVGVSRKDSFTHMICSHPKLQKLVDIVVSPL